MTVSSSLALFVSMVVLAIIPGPGVLSVTARSSVGGFSHGLSATASIVAGDYVFITLALAGVATLSNILGELFFFIKYVGAAYLVWMGLSLMANRSKADMEQAKGRTTHIASFTAGLITTLSNPKAILFYLSFFPAFLELASISFATAFSLYVIATVSIGGVMLVYAYMATKASNIINGNYKKCMLNRGAGTILIGSGIYVAARG